MTHPLERTDLLPPPMFIPTLLLLLQAGQPTYPGAGRPTVTVPRSEQGATVDGRMDEPAWTTAARLTEFHQYQPVDGVPAEEPTEVRVFYTAQAIYFGIIAHTKGRSSVNATLSKRDNLSNDDRVTIYLDTFDDKRRAFMFGVNALGVQLDGVRSEGSASAGDMFGGGMDLSPDYQFDSHGIATDSGYVVEVRIPFKSLRFPSSAAQRWGINVQRDSPSTGRTDVWTDARQASNSFLQQSGTLAGIENVERGIVTEFQPVLTSTYNGARADGTDAYRYGDVQARLGANLRVGFSALSLDATIRPDFSQVEADVGQVTVNERFALFFPETRPFFLEGIELFSTPNQLVYTREIVSPIAGGKVTGKLGRFGVAALSALDDVPGDPQHRSSRALFNIVRLRTDLTGGSVGGLTVTDRRNGDTTNTVVAGDMRLVFRGLYTLESQYGYSFSQHGLVSGWSGGPVWKSELDRTGRMFGFNYMVGGFGQQFETRSGFVNRTGIEQAHAFQRVSWYGSDRSLLQSAWLFGGPSRIWKYGDLLRHQAIEGDESLSGFLTFRGGWMANTSLNRNFYSIDPGFASGLFRQQGSALVAYVPPSRISGLLNGTVGINTPVFKAFNARAEVTLGESPIFEEGATGASREATASLGLRPSPSVRVETQLTYARLTRQYDGSLYSTTVLPRLKLEYQPTRALFVRLVGEYRKQDVAAPRDAVSHAPLLLSSGVGAPGSKVRALRMDWLLSFEPRPGTVAFLGYGSIMDRPNDVLKRALRRSADGLFVKLAYQFRR